MVLAIAVAVAVFVMDEEQEGEMVVEGRDLEVIRRTLPSS